MSKKYLFIAEADKIQDLLFRSARQRQIIGGSRLLAQFGKKMIERAQKADPIIWRGGSFVLSFKNKDDALEFRKDLQNLYHFVFDSTITCTEPKEYSEASLGTGDQESAGSSFAEVNKELRRQLNKNKRANRPETDVAHSPIVAYCQDTGTGLSAEFQSLLPGEENKKYLSQTAIDFGYAGGLGRKKKPETREASTDEDDSFLSDIRDQINNGELKTEGVWPKNIDGLGKLDPLNSNVAYMLADVNGMGEVFSCCEDRDDLCNLSDTLDRIMKQALVEHLPKLTERLQARIKKHIKENNWLPMLPLIFAGDDAFVLLPAHYALDFAARFCEQFHKKMQKEFENGKLNSLHKKIKKKGINVPTISAAVIFCKTKYPYHLAHQRGEALLKEAKRYAKYESGGKPCGAINFEVIVGNPLINAADEENGKYKPTLKPYWVPESEASEMAISITKLLHQRRVLKDIPQKRLAELRELFAEEQLKGLNPNNFKEKWVHPLEKKLKRFRAVAGEDIAWPKNLDPAVEALGGPAGATVPYWHSGRPDVHNHGFPDLIEVWNYAQDLKHELSDY